MSEVKHEFATLSEQLGRAAVSMTDDMIALGLTPGQAAGAVATAMMHAAWKVAASAALVEGRKPQPRRFVSLAKETTVRFVVVEQAAGDEPAPPAAMKDGDAARIDAQRAHDAGRRA